MQTSPTGARRFVYIITTQKNDMATMAHRLLVSPSTNPVIVTNLFTPIPIAFIMAERGEKRKS